MDNTGPPRSATGMPDLQLPILTIGTEFDCIDSLKLACKMYGCNRISSTLRSSPTESVTRSNAALATIALGTSMLLWSPAMTVEPASSLKSKSSSRSTRVPASSTVAINRFQLRSSVKRSWQSCKTSPRTVRRIFAWIYAENMGWRCLMRWHTVQKKTRCRGSTVLMKLRIVSFLNTVQTLSKPILALQQSSNAKPRMEMFNDSIAYLYPMLPLNTGPSTTSWPPLRPYYLQHCGISQCVAVGSEKQTDYHDV